MRLAGAVVHSAPKTFIGIAPKLTALPEEWEKLEVQAIAFDPQFSIALIFICTPVFQTLRINIEWDCLNIFKNSRLFHLKQLIYLFLEIYPKDLSHEIFAKVIQLVSRQRIFICSLFLLFLLEFLKPQNRNEFTTCIHLQYASSDLVIP